MNYLKAQISYVIKNSGYDPVSLSLHDNCFSVVHTTYFLRYLINPSDYDPVFNKSIRGPFSFEVWTFCHQLSRSEKKFSLSIKKYASKINLSNQHKKLISEFLSHNEDWQMMVIRIIDVYRRDINIDSDNLRNVVKSCFLLWNGWDSDYDIAFDWLRSCGVINCKE